MGWFILLWKWLAGAESVSVVYTCGAITLTDKHDGLLALAGKHDGLLELTHKHDATLELTAC